MSADHVPDVERYAAEALGLAREVGDEEVLARSLQTLAYVQQMHGQLEEADEKFTEALRISEARGFKALAMPSRVFLAAHMEWRGDFPRALTVLRQVAEEAREAWDGFHELFALSFRCKAHIAQGDHAEGLAVIHEGLTKAKDRDNKFFVGRFENTIGWLHQELGDFGRAVEHDRQGADIGKQIKNGNVEISSLINLGFDYLHLGEPVKALSLLEETQRRAEAGFGAHRWRWEMHVVAYLAETLIALDRPGEAVPQIERSLAAARATGSAKYIAKCHALRGEIAFAAGRWAEAEAEVAEALGIARRIGYQTLTWQCAHALSRVLAARGEHERGACDRVERAWEMARLAADTIQSVAGRLPDPAMTAAFLSWSRVRAVQDDLDRLRRG